MQPAMHIHDQKVYRIAPPWNPGGFPTVVTSQAIDPWEGRGMVLHFSTIGAAPSGQSLTIECAPPDPNDDTRPDDTAWRTALYVDDCGSKQSAEFFIDATWDDKVMSIEIELCQECKFYRVRVTHDPPSLVWNVHVLAEIHHLRTKDV